MKDKLKAFAKAVLGIYRRNPARINGLLAALLVGLAAKFGLALDASSVLAAVAAAGVIVLSAETTHRQSTPKK